jgi:hypothetical protein
MYCTLDDPEYSDMLWMIQNMWEDVGGSKWEEVTLHVKKMSGPINPTTMGFMIVYVNVGHVQLPSYYYISTGAQCSGSSRTLFILSAQYSGSSRMLFILSTGFHTLCLDFGSTDPLAYTRLCLCYS